MKLKVNQENSKIQKTKLTTNQNQMISINPKEQFSILEDKVHPLTNNSKSITKNQASNYRSKYGKQVFVSKLNITEFENLSTWNNNQTLENYLTTATLNSTHRLQTENKSIIRNFSNPKKIKIKPTSSTERISILKEQNKSRLVDRRIEDKKIQQEIESLISEQSRLRKSLDNTKDQLALGLVSRKILSINSRLKKIMNTIKIRNRNENVIELESEKDSTKNFTGIGLGIAESHKSKISRSKTNAKFILSNCTTYRTDWAVNNKKKIKNQLVKSNSNFIDNKLKLSNGKSDMGFNDSCRSMKNFEEEFEEFFGFKTENNLQDKFQKMHDDNLKIRQIFLDNKLIEQKNKISQNSLLMHNDSMRSFPNFFFLRKNKIEEQIGLSSGSQYVPSTNIENGVNLFIKSYRPEGFRQKANTNVNSNSNSKNKSINKKKQEISREKTILNHNLITEITNLNPKRNVQDIIEENDKANLLINNKEILDTLRNKKQKPRTAFITSTKSVRPVSKSSQLRPFSSSAKLNLEENFSLNSEMKNLRKIYTQVITDHKVIKHSVQSNYKVKKRKYQESDYDNLLKLWEMNQLEGDGEGKTLKNRRDHDEKKNNYLTTFTGTNRKFLNEVYKQVEYENRMFSKLKGYETNKEEDKVAQQKMHREFRKIARETMYMKRDYLGDDQDFEIKKQFEHHYSNLDQLQWLVKKKKVFQNIKPRFLNRQKD